LQQTKERQTWEAARSETGVQCTWSTENTEYQLRCTLNRKRLKSTTREGNALNKYCT